MNRAMVKDIPVVWLDPASGAVGRKLVIWLPGFGGTKDGMEPYLRDLSDRGFVALSFDPYQHGERRIDTQEGLATRVLSNIRKHFWPILAYTADDVPTVIDWAIEELGAATEVGMGGISMGGDISVVAAAMDMRIVAVSACVATPDWLRPGSHEPPGEPDAPAQACYDSLNPLTHLQRYRHCPAIAFQSGEKDTQVPPDGGQRFVAALAETYSSCPERLEVCLYPDIPHAFTDAMWQASLAWFARFLGG